MIFRLVRMTLRERKAGLVGAFVALVGASALVTAFGILLQSGIGSGVPTQRYAGAAVVVSGEQTFKVRDGKTKEKPLAEPAALDRGLVREIARVPGVRKAVGDISFPAQVVNGSGDLVDGDNDRPSTGHGWDSAVLGPFELTGGRAPERTGEVVLDEHLAERAELAPGDRVKLATTQSAARFTVTGIARLKSADTQLRSAPIFFTESDATRLSRDPGRVQAVGVIATSGTDAEKLAERIEDALPGQAVSTRTGSDRSQVENPDVANAREELQELAGSLGATVILIVMIVVASTLALNVHQRRRELALLRAIAATPRQVYKMMAAEALLVSGVATVLGCFPGILVAQLMRAALTTIGMVPEDFALSYGPVPMLVAVAAGIIAAEVAALGVARRAVAIRPVEAMGEAAVDQPKLGRGRVTLGVALFLLGVAAALLPLFFGSIFAVAGAGTGGLVMVIAVLLLSPPVVSLSTHLLARPVRGRTGPHGRLAVANTRANARRLAAGIGPLTLAIGFAMVQLFIPTTTAEAARDQAEQGTVADFTLSGAAGGVPVPAATDAARLPGVAAATGVVRVELSASRPLWGSPEIFEYQAQGVTPEGLEKTMDLKVTDGSVNRLREGTVALSSGAADTLGVSVGEQARLHLPDGVEAKPVVVAVYQRGLGFGDVTLPQSTVFQHSNRRVDDSVFVKATPDADKDKVKAALDDLGERYPGTDVLDDAGMSAAQEDRAASSVLTSALPLALVFGYLAIAVANTLVMATLSRVREFALLRLVGAPARQVTLMMRVETVIVVITAVVIGSAVPLLPLVTVSLGLTGSPWPYIPPLLYSGIVAAAAVIGALAILLPTRWALGTAPVHAIGLRE
ncbi:ABC transporter permease [Streptomyces sp. NPDC021098]|uniref:ABC transporter permease n=1 Tax=unclassified Streptomyces TaxID=2593676 RepID=UPI00378F6A40